MEEETLFAHDSDPYTDLFLEGHTVEKIISVRYTHPILDYIIEQGVHIYCDAPDEVDAYNNPLYGCIHNWFIPFSIWEEFQYVCQHMTQKERGELCAMRLDKIECDKKEFIKDEIVRLRQLSQSVDQTGCCT